jgi:hypothetical protein
MVGVLVIENPPKMVYDDAGRLIEVILSAEDFLAYLRAVASEHDWETLPNYLQDAIDRMLIDEVREEKESVLDLDAILVGDMGE